MCCSYIQDDAVLLTPLRMHLQHQNYPHSITLGAIALTLQEHMFGAILLEHQALCQLHQIQGTFQGFFIDPSSGAQGAP